MNLRCSYPNGSCFSDLPPTVKPITCRFGLGLGSPPAGLGILSLVDLLSNIPVGLSVLQSVYCRWLTKGGSLVHG